MELRDIRTFLAVSEELHFGRAAKRLHVSQGRVSQTIRALEREVGAALFERTSRQVRLTVLGERFRVGVQHGYDELTQVLRDCRAAAMSASERLRIGYAPSIGGGFTTRVTAAFEASYQRCTATLHAVPLGRGMRPEETLKNGAADVVLAWSPGGDGGAMEAPDLTVGPVAAEVPRGLLVPDRHPLTEHPTVSVEDLTEHELLKPPSAEDSRLRDLWTPRFTPSGRPIRHTAEDLVALTGRSGVLVEDVLTLVARGRGLHCTVTSLLDRFPFPGLRVLPIRDMAPMVVVPVWLKAADNAAIRAFAETTATFTRRRGAG
ncbi:DNA-binding transcriptional LysR family regulator [Actinoallomurus bryophytorum]|uniref:DNA-binding transcriptional LysR family regulator n=1 Tax=Actinoallomurus bryophytorum TaxID=1490222 RepID=A0A543CV76_9ACTN|nr:LysR family transcriptional regulator [Actinoallomurus bryophytorum]TQM00971.1 DNA-binding transcriptional LysR family regulator [Actinoallomurus bryophytorum]